MAAKDQLSLLFLSLLLSEAIKDLLNPDQSHMTSFCVQKEYSHPYRLLSFLDNFLKFGHTGVLMCEIARASGNTD